MIVRIPPEVCVACQQPIDPDGASYVRISNRRIIHGIARGQAAGRHETSYVDGNGLLYVEICGRYHLECVEAAEQYEHGEE